MVIYLIYRSKIEEINLYDQKIRFFCLAFKLFNNIYTNYNNK